MKQFLVLALVVGLGSSSIAFAEPASQPSSQVPVGAGQESTHEFNPFQEMANMHHAMNRLMAETMAPISRRVPTRPVSSGFEDQGAQFVLSLYLPGLQKEKIDVQVKEEMVRVSGIREEMREQDADGYFSQSSSYQRFSRAFNMPAKILPEKVTAKYEGGVLRIELPKQEPTPAPDGAVRVTVQ